MRYNLNISQKSLTEEQAQEIIKLSKTLSFDLYYSITPEWKNHIRNMTKGWNYVGPVTKWKELKYSNKLNHPGVYSIVYSNNIDETQSPLFNPNVIITGETVRSFCDRIDHHIGPLFSGATTNMTGKYRSHLPHINESIGETITDHPENIHIFVRRHSVTDKVYKYNRTHSVNMEKQCHAFYYVLHGKFPPGNTRDLPNEYLIDAVRKFIKEKSIKLVDK